MIIYLGVDDERFLKRKKEPVNWKLLLSPKERVAFGDILRIFSDVRRNTWGDSSLKVHNFLIKKFERRSHLKNFQRKS